MNELSKAGELSGPPVLVNGEFKTTIDVFDRGFMYGDGVFETIRVVNGQPLLWDYHIKRLTHGCSVLKIPTDRNTVQQLRTGLDTVVAEAGSINKTCVVKLVVSRGAGGRGYQLPELPSVNKVIICYPAPEYPPSHSSVGINMLTCQHRLSENPVLAGIKHLNRLDQVLASAELTGEVAEGLMLNQAGQVIEGTKSNVIFFEERGIVSPDTRLCGVDGVARQYIFDNVSELGLDARIDTVKPSEIGRFKGMAIINSVLGLWPVSRLDGRELPLSPLASELQCFLNQQLMYEFEV